MLRFSSLTRAPVTASLQLGATNNGSGRLDTIKSSGRTRVTKRHFSWTPERLARAVTTGGNVDQKPATNTALPDHASVVICGGGLVGLACAYELARSGIPRKIIVIEKNKMETGGVAWMSGGFVPIHIWADLSVMRASEDSRRLYREMAELHPNISLNEDKRIYMASEDDTVTGMKRMHAVAKCRGHAVELVNPSQISKLAPPVDLTDIKAGIVVHDNIRLNPEALRLALAEESKKLGVKIIDDCDLNYVAVTPSGAVCGVDTSLGAMRVDNFIDCSGMLSASQSGPGGGYGEVRYRRVDPNNLNDQSSPILHMKLPLQMCHHAFVLLQPPQKMDTDKYTDLVVHDLDKRIWACNTRDDLVMCGGFVPEAMAPVEMQHDDEIEINITNRRADWDRFYPIMKAVVERIPHIRNCHIQRLVGGIDCFTPDGNPIIGELPHIQNYFIAGGMNGFGVSLAGGIGAMIASLINKNVRRNISKLDVSRFLDLHANRRYLEERCPEVASLTFQPVFSNYQFASARNLRQSPIHHRLAAAGAVFGGVKGYERPLYFMSASDPYEDIKFSSTSSVSVIARGGHEGRLLYGEENLHTKPPWFADVAKEYAACRERVGLIDMSNFSKYDIVGNDDSVLHFLQKICSANIDMPIGNTVYTGMQNEMGGYVTDCTVSRLAQHQLVHLSYSEYFIIAPSIQQVGCQIWMEKWAKEWDGKVFIQDVTSMYTALNIIGPASRPLMEHLTSQSMGASEFPAFRCRNIDIGLASGIRAVSVTHCGELGWVLYIPNELAAHVYDRVVLAGSDYGLQHCGFYALRHLRIEKFYVFWGFDIGFTTTPIECGRDFRCDYSKKFIGRDALKRQKAAGIKRRYVQLQVHDHDGDVDPWPQGREPILRNGKYSGMTTSAAYGFTLQKQIALGFIENMDPVTGKQLVLDDVYLKSGFYEIEIADMRFPVDISLTSLPLPMPSSEHPIHYMTAR